MVCHNFELLRQLDGLIEGLSLSLNLSFNLFGSGFDRFLKLRELPFISIKLHVLPRLNEGGDELTVGLTHYLKIIVD